jgi:tetraacyldisaccharide 4'-kinase
MGRAARPLLWPLVPAYRFALALREFELRSGLKPVRRLGWPVIGIGNLSAGGAGKTPLTIALARALAARGFHVDVLSRGYGRRSALPLRVDPSGAAENFGDEPLLIARQTGVPVYVAAQRYEAGQLAEQTSGQGNEGTREPGNSSAVHLLDDGFQHRQLARNIDILLLSRRDLDDHLLPAGNLREALRAAERAQVIAIPEEEPDVAQWAEAQGWRGEIWRLRRRMEIPAVDGPVAAFCGIARPDQFFSGLEAAGVRLAARIAFADHHRYTAADIGRIASAASQAGAKTILTTEKDLVRLGALAVSLPLHAVSLYVEIEDEAAALTWLIQRLKAM